MVLGRLASRSRRRAVPAVVVAGAMLASGACGSGDGPGRPGMDAGAEMTSTTSVDSADDLGDGTHQVQIDAADLVGGSVTLDGVQVLSGMDAVLAYLADTDGAQLEGPQVYVRNGVATPMGFAVDAAGRFSVIPAGACCAPAEVGWSVLAGEVAADFAGVWGRNPPFTAVVDNGVVVSLELIHIP